MPFPCNFRRSGDTGVLVERHGHQQLKCGSASSGDYCNLVLVADDNFTKACCGPGPRNESLGLRRVFGHPGAALPQRFKSLGCINVGKEAGENISQMNQLSTSIEHFRTTSIQLIPTTNHSAYDGHGNVSHQALLTYTLLFTVGPMSISVPQAKVTMEFALLSQVRPHGCCSRQRMPIPLLPVVLSAAMSMIYALHPHTHDASRAGS